MQALCSTACKCSNTHYAFKKQKLCFSMKKEENSSPEKQRPTLPNIIHLFASPVLVAAALLTLSTPGPVSIAAEPIISKKAALFQKACIGCHDMGGNILQPGATLFTKDLERNGVATEEDIYNITYYGKGRMPGFGEKCTPRGQCTFGPRLQEDEIRQLAEFVKIQADKGWPNIEIYAD